jgi:hypothetical protein
MSSEGIHPLVYVLPRYILQSYYSICLYTPKVYIVTKNYCYVVLKYTHISCYGIHRNSAQVHMYCYGLLVSCTKVYL